MKHIYLLLISILLILPTACGDNEVQNMYDYPVDFKIFLNGWDTELKAPGVYKRFTTPDNTHGRYVGYGGLLVVSGLIIGNSSNIYPLYAYDLACPHEMNKNIRVEVNDNLEAVCPECNSTFNIFDGTGVRVSGTANNGLQRYSVVSDNANQNIFRVVR